MSVLPVGDNGAHFLEKSQLVRELRIDLRVRLVAPRRNIEIVDAELFAACLHHSAQVPAIAHVAKADLFHARQRTFGYRRHAMITLLAAYRDMFIAERAKPLRRK